MDKITNTKDFITYISDKVDLFYILCQEGKLYTICAIAGSGVLFKVDLSESTLIFRGIYHDISSDSLWEYKKFIMKLKNANISELAEMINVNLNTP